MLVVYLILMGTICLWAILKVIEERDQQYVLDERTVDWTMSLSHEYHNDILRKMLMRDVHDCGSPKGWRLVSEDYNRNHH